jgi:hypothetical protein
VEEVEEDDLPAEEPQQVWYNISWQSTHLIVITYIQS